VSATEVTIGVAAVSAIAAAASAFASYWAVALSHRPYIAALWSPPTTACVPRRKDEAVEDRFIFTVGLNNEGPGTALNVSCRVRSDVAPDTDWSCWSRPVYAISPGRSDSRELVGAAVSRWPDYAISLGRSDSVGARRKPDSYVETEPDWYVETEFSDIRGATWNVRRKSGENIDRRLCRLRSGRLDFWRPASENTKAERRRPGLRAARLYR